MLLGGVLTDTLGWEWVLWVNVPIGLAAAALAPRADRGEPLDVGQTRTFDVAGAVSSPPACRCWSTRWSTRSTPAGDRRRRSGCWRVSALLLAVFVVVELRSEAPLVPFRIFRLRTLTGANVVGLLVGASLFSMFFFISLYMQQVLGYSPIKSGFSYLPLALTIILAAGIASQLVTRLGFKPVLLTGLAFIAAGLLWFCQVSVGGELRERRARARRSWPRSGSGSRSCRSRSPRSPASRSAKPGWPAA